jgi:hypothetical protein
MVLAIPVWLALIWGIPLSVFVVKRQLAKYRELSRAAAMRQAEPRVLTPG